MVHKIPLQPPFLVIGLGKSGVGAKNLLLALGFDPSSIFTFDQKSEKVSADFHDPVVALQTVLPRTLIVSPGVPLHTTWIQSAMKSGISISSELGLASFFLESETVIGITGSVGKSTTTALLGEAVRTVDSNVFIGGNFGIPLVDYITQVLEKKRPRAAYIILELSSYQLENCDPLRFDHSMIVSLTPNHLERYSSIEDYYLTKLTLLRRTQRVCLISDDSPDLKKMLERISFREPLLVNLMKKYNLSERDFGHVKFVTRTRYPSHFFSRAKIFGEHNEANLALVVEFIRALSLPKEAQDAAFSYRGLSHRLETLGEKDGILFINDSKSTTIESVLVAVQATLKRRPNGKTLLLLGGRDKNLPWDQLKSLSKIKNIEFIFFGECGPLAKEKSNLQGPLFPRLKDALLELSSMVNHGDTVLLSPGGTSLDEFDNFEARGNFFRDFYFGNQN